VPGSQEECRTVVSECLGHLALLHPGPVLSQLEAQLKDPSPDMRAAVGGAGHGIHCQRVLSSISLAIKSSCD
jgi:hypothetical protein